MKIILDFLPIIAFFVAYKFAGIYVATAASIIFSLVEIIYLKFSREKVSFALILSTVIVTVFGGATIYFHNEWFIKLKPTIIYFILAALLFVAEVFHKANLYNIISGGDITFPEKTRRRINYAWMSFFILVGSLNLFVAYFFSTEFWVNFKLFGLLALTFLFAIVQAYFLHRHLE